MLILQQEAPGDPEEASRAAVGSPGAAPRRPQGPPGAPQDPPDGAKTGPRRPKTAQDGPKTTPRPPQDGPRRPQDGPKRPQDAPRAAPGASWTPLSPPRPPGTPSGHPPGPPRALENANVGTIWWSNWVRFGVYSRPPRNPRKCKCWNDLGVKLCPVWGLFGL